MENNNSNNLKFTIKFSEKDNNQIEIAKLLKQKGRKKSVFITKAIMFYLDHYNDNNYPERSILKDIVKEVIEDLEELNKSDAIEVKQHSSSDSEISEALYFESDKQNKQDEQKLNSFSQEEKGNNIKKENDIDVPDDILKDLLGGLSSFD